MVVGVEGATDGVDGAATGCGCNDVEEDDEAAGSDCPCTVVGPWASCGGVIDDVVGGGYGGGPWNGTPSRSSS